MVYIEIDLEEICRTHYEAFASGENPYPFPLGV